MRPGPQKQVLEGTTGSGSGGPRLQEVRAETAVVAEGSLPEQSWEQGRQPQQKARTTVL